MASINHAEGLEIEFGNDHGSVKSYIHGFILSLILTIIPFVVVSQHWFSTGVSYVIVGVFVVAMFLTPPDALSQTLLAVPMWMLFEVGLLFSRLFERKADIDENLPAVIGNQHDLDE